MKTLFLRKVKFETLQETKKSKVHIHSTIVRNEATGTKKLKFKYCTKTYAYNGSNTGSTLQHFRSTHRDMPVILANFPLATPKSNAKLKGDIAASSIVDKM